MRTSPGTSERVVDLIRRAPRTAREIAAELGVTYHAVRLHLLRLERDGVIHVSTTRGVTRPANVYTLKPGIEATLSRAYAPFASHLTRVLGEHVPPRQLRGIMREVGRRMAAATQRPMGNVRERTIAASRLLQELGAPNEVVGTRSALTIRSSGCVLAEAAHGGPEVCFALESFLRDYIGADVRQQCERGERPSCRFKVGRTT